MPDSGRLESERRRAFAASSTAHPGAQNGQLTAAQIQNMRGLVGDQMTASTSRYNTDAGLVREGMSQAGADRRAASRDAIDTRRLVGEEETRGYETRAAERVERLYQQLDAAETEEQRGEVIKQLQLLQSPGGSGADSYRAITQNVPIDPNDPLGGTRQEVIFYNQRTGLPAGARGEEAPRRNTVSMDEVNATARARKVSQEQVIEMLKQQGVSVDG